MGLSRQEYWSGLPLPSPGDLPDPGIKSRSPALQPDFLPSEPPQNIYIYTHTHTYMNVYVYIFIYNWITLLYSINLYHIVNQLSVQFFDQTDQTRSNQLSVQSLSHVQRFATPWTAAHQVSLSITNSHTLLKLMSIAWVMPSNHLILCRPLLLLPSIFPYSINYTSIKMYIKGS